MNKKHAINNLYEEYRTEFESEEIVLGEGNLDAKLLLIGEAPGRDEVRLSRPFVGMQEEIWMNFTHYRVARNLFILPMP